MDTTWTLGVLAAGIENVQPVAAGVATSLDAARATAAEALVHDARTGGRQEYRLRLAGTDLLLLPGLTHDGHIDTDALHDAVWDMRAAPSTGQQ